MEGMGTRSTRNIVGTLLSTLTGLVSEEQMRVEVESERELEKKIKFMLIHDVDMEKEMVVIQKELEALYYKGWGWRCETVGWKVYRYNINSVAI